MIMGIGTPRSHSRIPRPTSPSVAAHAESSTNWDGLEFPGLTRAHRRPPHSADGRPLRARNRSEQLPMDVSNTAPRAEIKQPERPELRKIMGPGLITEVSDDDPGGIATTRRPARNLGYNLRWTLLLTLMCAPRSGGLPPPGDGPVRAGALADEPGLARDRGYGGGGPGHVHHMGLGPRMRCQCASAQLCRGRRERRRATLRDNAGTTVCGCRSGHVNVPKGS